MKDDRQTAHLKALGRIEELKSHLGWLASRLAEVPLWMPSAALRTQCRLAAEMIDATVEQLQRRLVVSIIGPSGSGKSTLLNALAGGGHLSRIGHRRPTTRGVTIFSRPGEDLDSLADATGAQVETVAPERHPAFPGHLLLIDTPDTDSSEARHHLPAVRAAIAHSDMLICVFDAENPKRKDHVDFLAPLIRRFDGSSLLVVLNKCDRLDAGELQEQIFPGFRAYLQHALGDRPDRTFCICARRHLQDPRWDSAAPPKHEVDHFGELKSLLVDATRRHGFAIDRRVDNARALHDEVFREAARQLTADRPALEAAARLLQESQHRGLQEAVGAMAEEGGRALSGLQAAVFQRLAQMWLGPVGWLIAFWARLLVFTTGVTSALRYGRPVRRITAMVSTLRHFNDPGAAAGVFDGPSPVPTGLRRYRLVLRQHWPDISESLVRGRFDETVRTVKEVHNAGARFGERLAAGWQEALGDEINGISRKLSRIPFQILFNAPPLAVLGGLGWIILQRFWIGSYLPGPFFVHAFWVVAIILLMDFFLLQVWVRLIATGRRVATAVFERLKERPDLMDLFMEGPVVVQLERVLNLARQAEK